MTRDVQDLQRALLPHRPSTLDQGRLSAIRAGGRRRRHRRRLAVGAVAAAVTVVVGAGAAAVLPDGAGAPGPSDGPVPAPPERTDPTERLGESPDWSMRSGGEDSASSTSFLATTPFGMAYLSSDPFRDTWGRVGDTGARQLAGGALRFGCDVTGAGDGCLPLAITGTRGRREVVWRFGELTDPAEMSVFTTPDGLAVAYLPSGLAGEVARLVFLPEGGSAVRGRVDRALDRGVVGWAEVPADLARVVAYDDRGAVVAERVPTD